MRNALIKWIKNSSRTLQKKMAHKAQKTRPSQAQLAAHRELLNLRSRQAMWLGIAAFALNTVEPWFDFPDLVPVKIQLLFSAAMALLAASSYTRWGARHKLGIFTLGFLITIGGFEINVVYENAFGTSYSDGFPVFFAFYCVLIPAGILTTTLVGVAALAIAVFAEAWQTQHWLSVLLREVIEYNTAFFVLLYGRWVANNQWEAEFRSKEQAVAANERELAAIKLQTDFVSAVAHDFRTPLTPLCKLSEQLASGLITDPRDLRECYVALVEESGRLSRLILGLLEFGRIRAGATEYCFQSLDLGGFVQATVMEFERDIDVRGFHLQVQIAPDVLTLRADPIALKSVLWNLVDNAMKYSPDFRTIWLDVEHQAPHVVIRVRDQGFGVPESEQMIIFENFVRGNAAKANAIRGSGIGLAIVKHIVKAHGGEIVCSSKINHGTTFTLRLPVSI